MAGEGRQFDMYMVMGDQYMGGQFDVFDKGGQLGQFDMYMVT